jgi:hypothetical protein
MSPPTRQTLGEVLLSRGALAAAETELRAAVDINTNLVGADHWRTGAKRRELGLGTDQEATRPAKGNRCCWPRRARLLADGRDRRIRRLDWPPSVWPNTIVPGTATPTQ